MNQETAIELRLKIEKKEGELEVEGSERKSRRDRGENADRAAKCLKESFLKSLLGKGENQKIPKGRASVTRVMHESAKKRLLERGGGGGGGLAKQRRKRGKRSNGPTRCIRE